MNELKLTIHKIKGIQHGIFEMTLNNDLYALIGNNGSGKSSIMLCMAQLFSKHNLSILRKEDFNSDSYIEFEFNGHSNHWYYNNKNNRWEVSEFPHMLSVNGTYEGSLFYGNRFKDSKDIDDLLEKGEIKSTDIVDADAYIQEKLGEILHNSLDYYKGLKRIRNKSIADRLKVKNTPYFLQVNKSLISQYRMSSGECLLISLLHFIYNSLVRRSLPTNKPILMLIDEIELALHPIAVSRFINYLQYLIKEYNNLTVVVTSHAPEVIRMINPNNMFKLERIKNDSNEFKIINPCYPSYAIRDVYKHSGFDTLILVEDKLAKMLIERALDKHDANISRLNNVIPVGGYENVLTLHRELLDNNVVGLNTNIISILDGDVEHKISSNANYKDLPKMFLPIPSIEKYLHKILIKEVEHDLKKQLQDKLFKIKSLDEMIAEYRKEIREQIIAYRKTQQDRGTPVPNTVPLEESIINRDADGKKLWKKIVSTLPKSVTEDEIINKVFEIITAHIDLDAFSRQLESLLSNPYKNK